MKHNWTADEGYSPDKDEFDQPNDMAGSRIAYFAMAGVLIISGFLTGAQMAWWP